MEFSILRPHGRPIPVLVEIPHAGLLLDALALATLQAPARALGLDADLYVDRLYENAPQHGATVIVSHMSRYYCDLNRAEGDVDEQAVASGSGNNRPHGLIWHRTTESYPALVAPLLDAEFQRRLNKLYRPYHAAVQRSLVELRQQFGFAILLAAHSMPGSGRTGHSDTGQRRADIVPGSRGWTTGDPRVIRCPEELAVARGWSVAHDTPYRGGFTTMHYGRPEQGVHAVQVELNRELYMDERRLAAVAPGFARTQNYCDELVRSLGALDLRP